MRLITASCGPTWAASRFTARMPGHAEAKRHVGYCPEVDVFYEEMSGRQFVETMARLCGYPKARLCAGPVHWNWSIWVAG